jgi:hypothetical protein
MLRVLRDEVLVQALLDDDRHDGARPQPEAVEVGDEHRGAPGPVHGGVEGAVGPQRAEQVLGLVRQVHHVAQPLQFADPRLVDAPGCALGGQTLEQRPHRGDFLERGGGEGRHGERAVGSRDQRPSANRRLRACRIGVGLTPSAWASARSVIG